MTQLCDFCGLISVKITKCTDTNIFTVLLYIEISIRARQFKFVNFIRTGTASIVMYIHIYYNILLLNVIETFNLALLSPLKSNSNSVF